MPNQTKNFYYYLFGVLLYLSLIFGFIFNENLTGGAYNDYAAHREIIYKFSVNFKETFFQFNKENTRHSPFLLIILSYFKKMGFSDLVVRVINLHFLLLIIFFFYKCLKVKFYNYNSITLYLISLLLFLSPTFRSLSIWPDSRLHGVFFFIISIYFYLNFLKEKNNKKKFKFALLNTFYLCLASYFSPNFCLFAIFYLLTFFSYYKISKYLFIIVLFNFFLSIPALYYVFFLKIFFFLTPVSLAGESLVALNVANKIILISSIFLFYYIPFFFLTKDKYKINVKYLIILGILFVICVQFFNYRLDFTGGGIIYKFSNILFDNNYFLYFFSFLGVMLIFNLCYKSRNNFLIILLLILGNPQLEIYHKYYDPMLLIMFFTLFNINFDNQLLKKRIPILYTFNFLFLIANLMR
jgi:hypothetical protein